MNNFIKIPAVLMLMLLLAAVSSVMADITPDDITNALPNNLTHPYLFFTERKNRRFFPGLITTLNVTTFLHNFKPRRTVFFILQ